MIKTLEYYHIKDVTLSIPSNWEKKLKYNNIPVHLQTLFLRNMTAKDKQTLVAA